MANQKFSIHGHAAITLDADLSTTFQILTQDILPIAYYVKKVMLYLENDASLTKSCWVTYHIKDTTSFDSVIEDTKYMGLQNINQIAPVNGLDVYSFFRPISSNYSPQFFFLQLTDGNAVMVEQFTNIKVTAGNQLELELQIDTFDDLANGAHEIDLRVSMECVVA